MTHPSSDTPRPRTTVILRERSDRRIPPLIPPSASRLSSASIPARRLPLSP